MSKLIKNLVTVLLATIQILLASVLVADESPLTSQPVVVVSISGADDVLQGVQLIAEAVSPDIGQLAASWSNRWTKGMDRSRPAGVVIRTNGATFQTLGFLPVNDLKALFEALADQIGEPLDAGDGLYEISMPTPFFVKQNEGWAFIAQDVDVLTALPEDPVQLLEGLDTEYGVAVRAYVNNIPLMFRQMAMGWTQFGIQEQLSQLEGLEDARSVMQRKLIANSSDKFESLLNETETITLGWKFDPSSNTTHLDVGITAVEGTTASQRMEMIKRTTSQFAGFLLPTAAAQMLYTSSMVDEDIDYTAAMLQAIKIRSLEQLAHDNEISGHEAREDAQAVLAELFDVLIETVETGQLQGGASLVLEPGSFGLVAGGYVPDGARLEKSLHNLFELAQREDGFPEVDWGEKEYKGVRFHSFDVSVTDNRLHPVLGEQLEFALGTGEHCGYVSVGNDPVTLIKRVMDQSHDDRDELLPPSRIQISLLPVLDYLASISDQLPGLAGVNEFAASASGQDRVIVESLPVEKGVISRITLEEDVLYVFAKLLQQNASHMIQAEPDKLTYERIPGVDSE